MLEVSNRPRRYYQVVFVRVKDPEKFRRYLELMGPIVRRYGGALERRLSPELIYAEGIPKPDAVNVVFYDSREAFDAFNRDPAFQEIVHLRSESIDMLEVGGLSASGEVTDTGLAERVYTVEIARFGPRGAAGYRTYEEQARHIMERYGYRSERVLAPSAASESELAHACQAATALSFIPDVVRVAYFESRTGMERFHQDPEHLRIENELYPSAVAQSVWVIGVAHPSTAPAK